MKYSVFIFLAFMVFNENTFADRDNPWCIDNPSPLCDLYNGRAIKERSKELESKIIYLELENSLLREELRGCVDLKNVRENLD